MVMGATGDIRNFLKKMPYTVRVGNIPGGLSEFITIQAAITYCAQQIAIGNGAIWTVLIWPGTYTEVITCADGVNLVGEDKGNCIIAGAAVTLITMAACRVANLTLNNTNGIAIECNDAACTIEDVNINLVWNAGVTYGISEQTGGTVADIHIRNVRILSDTDSNEFAIYTTEQGKTFYIEECWIQGGDFGVAIAGSSWAYMYHNHVEVNTRPLGGGAAIYTNDAGAYIHMHGDTIEGVIYRVLGVITYKNANQQYEVWQGAYDCIAATTLHHGMLIQDAIDTAAAETPAPGTAVQTATEVLGYVTYTVLIHPGIYDEPIICSTYVNLKGVGPKGSVVIYQNNTDIITLATNVQIQNMTVRLGTLTVSRSFINDDAGACIARISDCVFEAVTPTNQQVFIFDFTAASNIIVERCSHKIGGTGSSYTLLNSAVLPSTIHFLNNDFEFTNPNATHINSAVGAVVTGSGNRWAGTGRMFSVSDITVTLDNDALVCTAGWTNTNSTMTLRNCAIEAPVVAGDLATVRLKNCSYRAISRTGTGNIIDESPGLKDAPWHIEKWDWMTALANAQVAVRGAPLDAGSGQVVIETLDSGAGVMAVETNPDLARSLGNHFTPARTPRFLTQISAHTDNASGVGNPAFDPHVAMFYGLRETLGNALPVNPEHHAGFIWTGAAFNASSDDGVATQTTALITPSDDTQHQLEVIVFGGVTTVGWVEFYVDGILVATHVTRIPVNALDWQHLIIGLGTGTGDTISVTLRNGGCQSCPA